MIGFEPTLMILEIIVLPLNYTLLKYIFGLGGIWTHIVYMQSKCSTNWTTSPSRVTGFEPILMILKTIVLPLNYTPKIRIMITIILKIKKFIFNYIVMSCS